MATLTPGAVYPVNAPFNTNPAYSGTFIPNLWADKLLIKFYENTMLAQVCNTDYEGQFKSKGDSIRIRTRPDVTIRPYEVGMNLQYEVPTPGYLDMQIDQGIYFGVKVSDVLQYQADRDLMNMFTEEAGKQMKIAIEEEVFYNAFVTNGPANANYGANAGALSGGYNLGTDVTPIDATNPNNVLQAILRMSSVMDEQNVPPDGRFLIISPYDRHLLLQTNIAATFFSGDSTSIQRTGKIGTLDRFTVYVSNLLPRAEAGKGYVMARASTDKGTVVSGAKARRMMVAGTKHAVSFAASIEKTEPMRDPTDFGDIVRGLAIYGRKVVKPETLVIAQVGTAT
jgi:hypothetical protein